jgi:hypothetical protein
MSSLSQTLQMLNSDSHAKSRVSRRSPFALARLELSATPQSSSACAKGDLPEGFMAVTFGEDALSESTIANVMDYIKDQKRQFVWASNFLLWDPSLVLGGAVLTHKFCAARTESLFRELRDRGKLKYTPSDGVAMFYAWFGGSNIPWHYDYIEKSSMTIYLSDGWKADYGGYFCWKDWDKGTPKGFYELAPIQAQMRLPLYNTFVYMTEAEWHSTTLTVPSAPPRFSLQLFFAHE